MIFAFAVVSVFPTGCGPADGGDVAEEIAVAAADGTADGVVDFDFDTPRTGWKFLNARLRGEIEARWRKVDLVVIHSTGFREAASFEDLEDYHRRVRGEEHGLVYHFVIGNGRGMRDGEMRATGRWAAGLPAADLRSPGAGDGAVAVALAGDFEVEDPTRAQLEALDELLDYFAAKGGAMRVRLHSEVEATARPCPGAGFPVDALRRAFPR